MANYVDPNEVIEPQASPRYVDPAMVDYVDESEVVEAKPDRATQTPLEFLKESALGNLPFGIAKGGDIALRGLEAGVAAGAGALGFEGARDAILKGGDERSRSIGQFIQENAGQGKAAELGQGIGMLPAMINPITAIPAAVGGLTDLQRTLDEQGVDPQTAANVAKIQGVANTVLGSLPFAQISRLAGAGVNVTAGGFADWATQLYLDAKGKGQIADEMFDPTDFVQRAIDAIGGAAATPVRPVKGGKPQDVTKNLDLIDEKNKAHEEALKSQSQTTLYVGEDQVVSPELGTKITEDPGVAEYARAQVQDRLATQDPKKYSYWEPQQGELFDPMSGPHYPDQRSAGQLPLDLQTDAGPLTKGAISEPSGMAAPTTPEFKNWFSNSKVRDREGNPIVMYHGTPSADITEFKPNKKGLIFVTKDQSMASNFATKTAKSAEWVREQLAPSVYPVYVRAENPFEFWKDANAQVLADRLFANTPAGKRLSIAQHNLTYGDFLHKVVRGDWGVLEDSKAIEAIKDLGYDSLYVQEGGQRNLAVFDPNQLKSQFNKGTFGETAELSGAEKLNPADQAKLDTIGDVRYNYLTDEDYRKALAKRIAANPQDYTAAQKFQMMEDPRKHITGKEVATILKLRGPATRTAYDPQDLPSYNPKTGEFTGSELVQKMIDDSQNRGYKVIMKYIVKHLQKLEKLEGDARLRFAMDLDPLGNPRKQMFNRTAQKMDDKNWAAYYDSNRNVIWFSAEGFTPHTIIHETLHGLTVRYIELYPNDPKVQAIKFIFESIRNDPIFHTRTEDGQREYGLQNMKEMISEAFSNPMFQAKLLMHKVEGLGKTVKNAMNALAEEVRKILGLPDIKTTDTLENLIMRIDDIVHYTSEFGKEIDEKWHTVYAGSKKVEGIKEIAVATAEEKFKARLAQYKQTQQDILKAINGPSPALSDSIYKEAHGNQVVDAEDAKAKMVEGTTGVQHLAKDPVVDEALIEKIAAEPDGSDMWAMTPGALARAIRAKSTLVLTGYRLMDNASKRIAFLTKKVIAPVEKSMVKLIQSGDQGKILHDIFMRELKNKRDYDADELRDAGVSDEAIMAHLEFRTMMQEVLDRQNQARRDKGLEPVDRLESYLASRWSGPWRANLRDEDGRIVWQIAEHNKGRAKKALEHILAKEPTLKADDITYKQGRERSDSVEAGYHEMLKLLDPQDPRTQTLQSIYEEYVLGNTEDVAQQEKHFLTKTGVRGYAGDRSWAKNDYKDFFIQQFEYAKNAIKWSEYQTAVDKLKPLLHDPKLQESQKNNIAYLKEYSKNHLGFGTSELFSRIDNAVAKALRISPDTLQSGMGAAKTYFYLSRLGLSIPFTITQFIQPAITTPGWHSMLSSEGYKHNPVNTAIMGTVHGAGAALWHYIKLLGGNPSFVERLMDPVDKDAVRWMEANGITDINQLVDIKRDLRPRAVKKLAMPFEFTIKHSETIARSMAFMAFVQHLKQSGKFDLKSAEGKAALYQKAEDMTKISMTDYRSTERALMFERGGLTGDAAATLHSYQLNNLFQLWHFGNEFKKGNVAPLANMMFMQMVAAGAMGLWFIDDLDDLWDNFKKVMPHDLYMKLKNTSIKGFILENFNDLAAYGLVSKIGGTNMHTRMSAADQIPIMPFEKMDLTSLKGFGQSVANSAGGLVPFAGTTGNLLAAGKDQLLNAPDRDKWESAYAAAPAVAQGPMENLPAFNAGPVSKSPTDLGKGVRRRTEDEKFLRNLGLRSTAEQKQKDKEWGNTKIEMELTRRMQSASQKATSHFLDGNPKRGVGEIIKYVDLGGEPAAILNTLPKAQIKQVTTEIERRALDAGSGSRAAVLKLKRYLDNVGVQ